MMKIHLRHILMMILVMYTIISCNTAPEVIEASVTAVYAFTSTMLPTRTLEMSTLIPVNTPTSSPLPPTATITPQLTSTPTLLPEKPSYLLFTLHKDQENFGGILSLPDKSIIEFPAGYSPIGWSPSGKNLLLLHDSSGVYLADSLGENIRFVYKTATGFIQEGNWWIDEDTVFVTVYTDDNIQIGILNVLTKHFELLESSIPRWIVDVFPNGSYLYENVYGEIYLASLDNPGKPVFQEIDAAGNRQQDYDPSILFLPSGDGIVLAGCDRTVKPIPPCYLYYSAIVDGEILSLEPVLEFESGPVSIRVSPDSRFVSIVEGEQFTLFDLGTKQVVTRTQWLPTRKWPSQFIWSPNSSYLFSDINTIEFSGLVIFNPFTGTYDQLLQEKGSFYLVDWRSQESFNK